jgi:chorismate mutase-like protein
LDTLRTQIDELDVELLRLLNKRASIVLNIQEIKKDQGTPSYSAKRESQILDRVRSANEGPLPNEAIEDIFRCILQHSLASLRTTNQKETDK